MLTNFLIYRFVKDYENTKNPTVRKNYGLLSGITGICINLFLSTGKFLAGLSVNSLAIMADAFNDLSDVASAIVTLFGFILSGRKPDPEHPFGYGRVEYIAGLIVSFLILLVGYEVFKSSVSRILHPSPIHFNILAFLIVLISVAAKIWLTRFNGQLAKTIGSQTLAASSFESFGDVISSSCVALSLLASLWTDFPLDGYIGLIVAVIILYAGFNLTKDTMSPLLGESNDSELSKKIIAQVRSYENVLGVHDLVIHSYGPGRHMASLHAEVPADHDIMDLHEMIDKIEKEVSQALNIFLTIHMDPLNTSSAEFVEVKGELEEILAEEPKVLSYHDLRIVGKGEVRNILFDVVVKPGMSKEAGHELREEIQEKFRARHPQYACVIHIDRDFCASE